MEKRNSLCKSTTLLHPYKKNYYKRIGAKERRRSSNVKLEKKQDCIVKGWKKKNQLTKKSQTTFRDSSESPHKKVTEQKRERRKEKNQTAFKWTRMQYLKQNKTKGKH